MFLHDDDSKLLPHGIDPDGAASHLSSNLLALKDRLVDNSSSVGSIGSFDRSFSMMQTVEPFDYAGSARNLGIAGHQDRSPGDELDPQIAVSGPVEPRVCLSVCPGVSHIHTCT